MITLINGRPQTLAGLVVPNGSIGFQLNCDATVIAAPFGIVSGGIEVVFQFDANGAIQPNAPAATAQIYSNAELNPQNHVGLATYYLVAFYDANGARINQNPMWWQFPESSGATVDIGDMTAISTVGGNVIFYPTAFGGGGTVKSVAFVGDGVVLSGTPSAPVTTTGNISATLLTQSANTFLAGPTSGAAANPTFRTIQAADLPAMWDALNVLNFGADPSGSNDSSAAIQSAIDACTATQGLVYIPGGTYLINTALTGSTHFAALIGDGVQLSILKVAANATNSVLTNTTTNDGFKLKGLQFVGPNGGSGTQSGVTLSGSGDVSDGIFEDLLCVNWTGNFAFHVVSPIVCSFKNIRTFGSLNGIYFDGGTSCAVSNCYMNRCSKFGYYARNNAYSSFSACAADTCGLSYVFRDSANISILGSGHEAGTALNLTVTNTQLTGNAAIVTYSGADQSADYFLGLECVVASTANGSGVLNGRWTVTSMSANTIHFTITTSPGDFNSSDTGTASVWPGDGMAVCNATAVVIDGFFQHAAQQATSVGIYVDGGSNATTINGLQVQVGSGGTLQTNDIWIAANSNNTVKLNNVLTGGSSNFGTNIQTYSNGLWTLGGVAANSGIAAAAGVVRLAKTSTVNWKNNAGTADNTLAVNTSDQLEYNGVPFAPQSVQVISLRDDFTQSAGSSSVTTAGALASDTNWGAVQISGGTQSVTYQDGTFAHPGQLKFSTSASSGQGCALYRGNNAGGGAGFGALGSNGGWEINFILELGQTSLCAVRFGICEAGGASADSPTDGFWVEYDTANGSSSTDFTWTTAIASDSGTHTYSTTNAIAADTSFHHFRIRSTAAGTIAFSVDGGTEYTTAANISAVAMGPFFQIISRTSATKNAVLDFISYLANPGRA